MQCPDEGLPGVGRFFFDVPVNPVPDEEVVFDELVVPVLAGWHLRIGAGDLGSDLFAGRLSYQVPAYGDHTVELRSP